MAEKKRPLAERIREGLADRLRANGCQVYLAATAAEARDYILRVCAEPGVMIKSKSNAVKELGVREPLEARSITWIDTDMGDWINQLAGVEGAHLLAPAIQHTREDVARIFGEWLGETLPSDPAKLIAAARKGLRGYLETARYGMTGANAIAAAEGVVVLMENEGNIRAVTAMPPVHIVVASGRRRSTWCWWTTAAAPPLSGGTPRP